MTQLMWNPFEAQYRGQSPTGEVVTVDEDVMNHAIKKAGSGVFEVAWWLESLPDVLQHWGYQEKRWTDPSTRMPRVNYSFAPKGAAAEGDHTQPTTSGFLRKLTTTGPLTTRLLNTNKLDSGRLEDK
jgi:hypothetical protein